MTVIFALTGYSPLDLEDTEMGDSSSWKQSLAISSQLQDILTKMTAQKIFDRYYTIGEILEDLEPLTQIGKIVGNHYKIAHYLGNSVASYTYLAQDISQPEKSTYILKKLRSQLSNPSTKTEVREQFSRALTSLKNLGNHSQIPKMLDQLEQGKEFYWLQEFIEGKTLAEALKNNQRLSQAEVLKPNLEVKLVKISRLKSWQKLLFYGSGTVGLLALVIYVIQISQAGFLFTIADLRLKAGEYETAIEYFDEGLKKAPLLSGLILNFEKAWIQKAYALSALKEYDKMQQACEGAIALLILMQIHLKRGTIEEKLTYS